MTEQRPHSEELSNILVDAMLKKGLTIAGIAKEVGVVYETVRRIVNTGDTAGETPTMKMISQILGVSYPKVKDLCEEANAIYRYPEAIKRIIAKHGDPSLGPIVAVWKYLTDEQKQDAVELMQTMAKRTRRLGGVQ